MSLVASTPESTVPKDDARFYVFACGGGGVMQAWRMTTDSNFVWDEEHFAAVHEAAASLPGNFCAQFLVFDEGEPKSREPKLLVGSPEGDVVIWDYHSCRVTHFLVGDSGGAPLTVDDAVPADYSLAIGSGLLARFSGWDRPVVFWTYPPPEAEVLCEPRAFISHEEIPAEERGALKGKNLALVQNGRLFLTKTGPMAGNGMRLLACDLANLGSGSVRSFDWQGIEIAFKAKTSEIVGLAAFGPLLLLVTSDELFVGGRIEGILALAGSVGSGGWVGSSSGDYSWRSSLKLPSCPPCRLAAVAPGDSAFGVEDTVLLVVDEANTFRWVELGDAAPKSARRAPASIKVAAVQNAAREMLDRSFAESGQGQGESNDIPSADGPQIETGFECDGGGGGGHCATGNLGAEVDEGRGDEFEVSGENDWFQAAKRMPLEELLQANDEAVKRMFVPRSLSPTSTLNAGETSAASAATVTGGHDDDENGSSISSDDGDDCIEWDLCVDLAGSKPHGLLDEPPSTLKGAVKGDFEREAPSKARSIISPSCVLASARKALNGEVDYPKY